MNKRERKQAQTNQCANLSEKINSKFTPKYDDEQIVNTCIMKAQKGEWHVFYEVEGDTVIRDKKCKSKTKAEEWVAKHSKNKRV